MYKALLAVVMATGCAAVFVGFVPPPGPALAVVPTAQRDVAHVAMTAILPRDVEAASAACAQAWPYYEPSCLHDSRRQDGRAAVARVVVAGKSVADRIQQAQH
jgi:hypothetical protein